jgi:phospholipid/cholesterol/gamma-HCH transport system permease protein
VGGFINGIIRIMALSSPRISIDNPMTTPCLRVQGTWTAHTIAAHWKVLKPTLQNLPNLPNLPNPMNAVVWDLRELEALDHLGAQLLWNTWKRQWPTTLHLLPNQRTMLERVAQFSAPLPPPPHLSVRQLFLRLGAWVMNRQEHITGALHLIGQLGLDGIRLMKNPRSAPWRDVSGNLYRIGATALPITAMVGFLIGVVLAYLMAQQLRQFGADTFIVNLLGIALIRELGPVLAAILLAGRSGSAITAQIGVMRVTEELDAMQVMGIPKGFRLVLPRVLAMLVATPLIAVWTTIAALLGGMVASEMVMGLSPSYFVTALARAVQVSNLWLAVAKSAVFGVMIALIGCHYGLRIQPNTQSLGEGTTASVVTSITMVILVDALFAVVFKEFGL